MATRTSFRPRPVDVNKQLTIVRDLSELDTTDGLLPKEPDPTQQEQQKAEGLAEGAPASSSQPAVGGAGAHVKKHKPKEIPVPEVKTVPTYTRDYLPTFKIPNTYIRGKGGTAYATDDYIEYDLDNEDEDWLEAFNRRSDNRLSDTKFERMLWQLELAWSEAAEASLAASERTSSMALASTACLSKVHALTVLRKCVGGRDVILEQVYEYWAGKRKRLGKPMLRRLQAPTNPTDTNPFNVFRPREKANRPLTRRRRENSAECLEKLRQIRENMLRAMQLVEMVMLRERRKAELHGLDMLLQRCQLSLHHQAPQLQPMVEHHASVRLMEARQRCVALDQRLAVFFDVAQQGTAVLDETVRQALRLKRRRIDRDALAYLAITTQETLAKVPPPIPVPDLEPLWAYQPSLLDIINAHSPASAAAAHPATTAAKPDARKAADGKDGKPAGTDAEPPTLAALSPTLQAALQSGAAQPYVGRGGRLVLARCDPLSLEPFGGAVPTSSANDHTQAPGSGGGAVDGSAASASQPPVQQQEQLSVGAVAAVLLSTGGLLPPPLQAALTAAMSPSTAGTPPAAPPPSLAPAGVLPPPADLAAVTAAVLSEPVPDAQLLAFQPAPLSPWALAFDLRLLPDCVEKQPVLAAQQRYLRQQQLLGRGSGGSGGAGRGGVAAGGRVSSGSGTRPRGSSGSGMGLHGGSGSGGLTQRSPSPATGNLMMRQGSGALALVGGFAGMNSGAVAGGAAGVAGMGLGGAHKLLPQSRAVTGPSFQLNRGRGFSRGTSQGPGSDLGFPMLDGMNDGIPPVPQ